MTSGSKKLKRLSEETTADIQRVNIFIDCRFGSRVNTFYIFYALVFGFSTHIFNTTSKAIQHMISKGKEPQPVLKTIAPLPKRTIEQSGSLEHRQFRAQAVRSLRSY